MCNCDACGKRFRPPIIYNEDGSFKGFDYLCSSCQHIGRWQDTEEGIRKHDWHRVTTLGVNVTGLEKLWVNIPQYDYFES